MPSLVHERVYKQTASAAKMLGYAQREAEAMVNQDLADDLLEVLLRLGAIVRSLERNRYRSPERIAA